MTPLRIRFVVLIFGVGALAACDSTDSASGFEDVGLGVRVGEARTFTWSADGEHLYYTQDEPIVGDGGVITGARYEIFEATPGGTVRTLYEGVTSDASTLAAAASNLVVAGGALFFYTDYERFPTNAGAIYRLPLDDSGSPEVVVEGAADPARVLGVGSGESFAVSSDGRRLAYYAGEIGGPYEVHVRELSTGAENTVAAGGASDFSSLHYLPLLLSEDGSQLLHQLGKAFNEYTVVNIESGSAVDVELGDVEEGLTGEQFYAEGSGFVAVYVRGFDGQLPVVVWRLPDGSPELAAELSRERGGSRADLLAVDAIADRYAFWRIGQSCAVHVMRLDSGDEQRVAGPMPRPSVFCSVAPEFSPDGGQIAYFSPSSRELYVASVQP